MKIVQQDTSVSLLNIHNKTEAIDKKTPINIFDKAGEKRKYYNINHGNLLMLMNKEFEKGIVVRHDKETLWIYQNDIWNEYTELMFKNYITELTLGSEHGNISNNVTENVITNAYKHVLRARLDKSYIGKGEGHNGGVFQAASEKYGHIIATNNFYINAETMKKVKPEPKYYKTKRVPIDIYEDDDFSYSCPQWLEALDKIYEGDGERIQLIKEMFGYCLLTDCRFPKIFILFGDGGTGKSQILEMLQFVLNGSLHNKANTSAVSMDQINGTHTMQSLAGKLANICDENPKFVKDSANKMKAISSGSTIEVNPKNRDMYSTAITCKLIFSSNEKPNFGEVGNAIERRLILIPHNLIIHGTDKEKLSIARSIAEVELKDIFFWALEGLKELIEKNGFTESKAVKEAFEESLAENDPVKLFFDECLEVDENSDGSFTDVIWSSWESWTTANGVEKYLPTKPSLVRKLKSYLPKHLRNPGGGATKTVRDNDGKLSRKMKYLNLKPEAPKPETTSNNFRSWVKD